MDIRKHKLYSSARQNVYAELKHANISSLEGTSLKLFWNEEELPTLAINKNHALVSGYGVEIGLFNGKLENSNYRALVIDFQSVLSESNLLDIYAYDGIDEEDSCEELHLLRWNGDNSLQIILRKYLLAFIEKSKDFLEYRT